MYRARVQAVSGSKIYADGKWLTCIGNKNFRAGEMVWTDGRCTYGHFQESQQPLIIPAPPDDEGIPVLMYDVQSKKANADYYTCSLSTKCKKVASEETSNHFFLWNDTKGHAYIHKKTIGYFSNSGEIDIPSDYYYGYKYTLAANIDKQGNIYEIRKYHKFNAHFEQSDVGEGYVSEGTEIIHIIKNGEILFEFDGSEFLQEIKNEAHSTAYSLTPGKNIALSFQEDLIGAPWGVIENENSWAFVLITYSNARYEGSVPYRVQFPEGHQYGVNGEKTIACSYLYTPNDKQLFSRVEEGGYNTYGYNNNGFAYSDWNLLPESSVITPINDKLPIQDDYYFKINDMTMGKKKTAYMNHFFPKFANISIYSPDNKLLFEGNFNTGTYFTIFKGKILGVDDKDGYGLVDRDSLNIGSKEKAEIESGLYLIKNKKLEPLIKGIVRNWKLRPMKKIKGWQKRIKEISLNLEQDEN